MPARLAIHERARSVGGCDHDGRPRKVRSVRAAILVHLDGDEGEITGDAFIDAGQSLLDLAKGAASREDEQRVTWVLGRLSTGSATLGLTAHGPVSVIAAARDAIADVMAGLAQLQERAEMPPGFTEQMTRRARDLSRLAGRQGVAGVTVDSDGTVPAVGPLAVTPAVGLHAEQALGAATEAVGSVHGVFDRLNLRDGRREVSLRDESSGRSVPCSFPPGMLARITDSLLKSVTAWGTVRRNAAGQKVSLLMEEFELTEKEAPVPIRQLVGIFHEGWTGGQDSVTFVRSQRGE